MGSATSSFRIGRVRVYCRGRVWYLCYFEQGHRRQPRVGPDRTVARQMASEINSQLESGSPSALGFEPISIPELRQRWLNHHEHVRRSSVQTIRRYRSATEHLLQFVTAVCPVRRTAEFRAAARRTVCAVSSIQTGGSQWSLVRPVSGDCVTPA